MAEPKRAPDETAAAPSAPAPHLFRAGHDPRRNQNGGPLGPKRLTRDLRHGIIDAATALGSDGRGTGGLSGYLTFLAAKHPKAFASLLGKLLPLQISGNVKATIGAVNIVAVPGNRYLAPDDIGKLAPAAAPAPMIEHDASDGADDDGADDEAPADSSE